MVFQKARRRILIPTILLIGPATACSSAGRTVSTPPSPGLAALSRDATRELDIAEETARRLSTPESASRAGFHRIAPARIPDLIPFMGEHWINEQNLRVDSFDLQRPAYLMFYPLDDSGEQTLVGTAYGISRRTTDPWPKGFTGDADRWHAHLPCTNIPALRSILADNADDCRSFGGEPAVSHIVMVHFWFNVPNPLGPFADDNRTFPYVRVGLTPPDYQDFTTPEPGRRARKLALALGETYGALPRMGARVDPHPDSSFSVKMAPHRDSIRALLPGLQRADRTGDRAMYERLANQAIAEWEIIRQAYLDEASSKELRIILERWFRAAVDPMHGSKMD